MPRPSVTDDGASVTLDLHGAMLHEAEDLVFAAVEIGAEAGRSTLRVVHGASTTDWDGGNRTVKTAVLRLLDSGALDLWVASAHRTEGHVLIGLRALGPVDRRPITLDELES
ncbi:MAG: Smr/MutS family protein [Bacteroidota bacterium]